MKSIINGITTALVASITAIAVLLVAFGYEKPASAEQPSGEADVFSAVSDKTCHELTLQREAEKRAHAMSAWNARQEEREAAEASIAKEDEVLAEYWYWEDYAPSQTSETRGNPDGLNSFHGTYDYNGKHETFYGSSAVYDSELHVDEDGFWRTDDGHYVVASVDYPIGTEIEMSEGMAIVYDDGCAPGTVDVHTNW